MKKCPSCDKTFEDSMRFCQVDGSPLVADAPAFDPYATIVGRSVSIEPVVDSLSQPKSPDMDAPPDADIHYTVGSIPISEPDDVLDLPSNDPLKTMYVSEAEMQAALTKEEAMPDIIDIQPIEETTQPEPPSFIASEPSTPSAAAPPSSPFSGGSWPAEPPPPVFRDPEPTPSYEPVSPQPTFDPAPEKFDEAATMIQPSFQSPFDQAPAPVAEWMPPPVPESSWQNQEIGSNTPFQPPPAGVTGENKTLAIVSLVLGILGIFCCGLLTGIPAIVTGYLAKGKIDAEPHLYGGRGLATAGMIMGVVSIVLTIIGVILQIALGVFSNLN